MDPDYSYRYLEIRGRLVDQGLRTRRCGSRQTAKCYPICRRYARNRSNFCHLVAYFSTN
jgi:hypothetical protein